MVQITQCGFFDTDPFLIFFAQLTSNKLTGEWSVPEGVIWRKTVTED